MPPLPNSAAAHRNVVYAGLLPGRCAIRRKLGGPHSACGQSVGTLQFWFFKVFINRQMNVEREKQ